MRYLRKNAFFVFIIFEVVFIFLMFFPYSWDFFHAYLHHSSLELNQMYLVQNDYISQAIPFLKEFIRMVRQGNLFYSWNTFLGTNFYTNKAMFLIGDVYAWLSYLLSYVIDFIPSILLVMTWVRLAVAGMTCYGYLRYLKRSELSCFVGGILYLSSGWALIFLEQLQFLSFYTWLPLVLLGVEIALDKQKYGIYVLSMCLIFACNFYLAYSF